MKRLTIRFIFLAFIAIGLKAEVRFSDLNLSSNNRLLFRTTVKSPGFGNYDTLILADLNQGSLRQLTYFPERVALLEDRQILQIQNRFGVFRTDAELKNISPIDTFSSFVNQNRIESGKLMPIQISPDGLALLYMRQKSPAFGELVLFDLKKSSEFVISSGIELSLKSPPVLWSPDSRFLVYSKAGNLYYFSLSQLAEQRVIAEEYRLIGEGLINNARWGEGNSLYYISGSLIYELDSRELFTRALYSGFLKIGKIGGKIPFRFDSNFDSFWIAPGGTRILFCKGGRNIFLYPLSTEDFISIGRTQNLPYLYLPRNTRIRQVLWSESDIITILTESVKKGQRVTSIFRLPIARGDSVSDFQPLEEGGVLDLVLSPGEDKIALIQEDQVVLKNYRNWALLARHTHPQPLHAQWTGDDGLIIAGRYYTELWNQASGESRRITISQPEQFGFSRDTEKILMSSRATAYSALPGEGSWEEIGQLNLQEARILSESFRVYLEDLARPDFQNMIMIRDARGFGTRTLFRLPAPSYEMFPQDEEAVDFVNFSHGSRIRQRTVALVFNAIDSIEGLTTILNVLQDFQVRATFFINGEMMRRYPDAVQEIAESGYEVGSLFSVHFDMTDSRFKVDREFIKKGLAHNEDDYFRVTGRELSLLWHAPYYFVSSEIIEASKEMNYTYVGRDIDSLDWVTEDMDRTTPGIYFPAAQLVERILEKKKPGSIIPVMTGVPKGQRVDYLFQRLDLLIDGLIKKGYRIVPVTTLMEQAK